MSSKLHISMLGPLQVTAVNKTVVFRTDALRVLLAYLAVHQGIPQRRDTLAALLSPDRPDKEALTYLRNRLTRLRQALGDETAVPPYLEIDRKQIALRDGDDTVVDVTRFEHLLTGVATHAHRQLAGCPACLARLAEAVDLVRGELLAGLNFPSETWETWLMAQREHVQQRALEGMTLLREARVLHGEWTAVLDIAQRQLNFEPWLEAAHQARMLALYHLGDRNAALAQYDQCAQLLGDELGVEPEEETRALRQQIFDNALDWNQQTEIPDNLPPHTTRYFGREKEQTQLLHRLVDPGNRLITLVGTGGVGKTRLAIEVGQQVKMSFPDGVWFVPLDAVQEGAEQIKIAIGEAAGLGQSDKQLTGEQVLVILRDKQLLLIMDNCETVLDDLDFIPQWLRRAPKIGILATSREPLNFVAESVLTLEGLPIGDDEISAAEALFAERAQMARDDFVITAVTLPHIRRICQLVDGLPLGISLAAAWARRRSLPQIINAIGDSIDFLRTRQRDVDPRHRSMRAVFETSWQMLAPSEQGVLAALAAFPGSFSAEAAAKIADASLLELDALCEKSLLQQNYEAERYSLHGLVQQFAAQKLGRGITAVEQAFFTYYYAYANQNQDDDDQLQQEWVNFSAALRRAHAHQAWQMVLDLVRVLDEPWFRQLHLSEMDEGLTLALDAARETQDQAALAWTLLRLGEIEVERSEYKRADVYLADALILMLRLGDNLGVAQTKYLIGRIRLEQTHDDQAILLSEESRRLFEEAKDWLGVAKNLNQLALLQIKKYNDFQTAQAYLEQSVTLQRALPPSSSYIEALRHLARVKGVLEAYDEAESCIREAVKISQQKHNLGDYAAVLYERLLLCKKQQQLDEALAAGHQSLTTFEKLGSLRWEALIKTQLGLLHQTKQNYQQALLLLDEALQSFTELGDRYEQAYAYYYLCKLYAEINKPMESQNAKEKARQLNRELNIPSLEAKLC